MKIDGGTIFWWAGVAFAAFLLFRWIRKEQKKSADITKSLLNKVSIPRSTLHKEHRTAPDSSGKFKRATPPLHKVTDKKRGKAPKSTGKVHYFPIVGMKFNSARVNKDEGFYEGYVCNDYSDYDRYSIAVHNDSNRLLGYVPKGKRKLHNELENFHDGKISCWGYTSYSNGGGWSGSVYVPIGFSQSELTHARSIAIDRRKLFAMGNFKTLEDNHIFHALALHQSIQEAINGEKLYESLNYNFPVSSLLTSLSKRLETNADWDQLIRLEGYRGLILTLSERYQKSIFKRINKAQEKI